MRGPTLMGGGGGRVRDYSGRQQGPVRSGAGRAQLWRDRATNLAALYESVSGPSSPERVAYDISDVSTPAPTAPAPVPAPQLAQPPTPAPGSAPAAPAFTTITAEYNNNAPGYYVAGTGTPGTMVRVYYGPMPTLSEYLATDAVLAPGNTWSAWVPAPPAGQPVQYVATAFYPTDPTQTESAYTPSPPIGTSAATGAAPAPVLWLGSPGGIANIPPPILNPPVQTVVPGSGVPGVIAWLISGTSLPGTIVRLYALPADENPVVVADSTVVQGPLGTFSFPPVSVPPGVPPMPVQVRAYSASDPQHLESQPSKPTPPLTGAALPPSPPSIQEVVVRPVPAPSGGLVLGVIIRGTSEPNTTVRVYAVVNGMQQRPALAQLAVPPDGTEFTLTVPLTGTGAQLTQPVALTLTAYSSADPTMTESSTVPVPLNRRWLGAAFAEGVELALAYAMAFEVFDEVEPDRNDRELAMSQVRAGLAAREVRLWMPRQLLDQALTIWGQVEQEMLQDAQELGYERHERYERHEQRERYEPYERHEAYERRERRFIPYVQLFDLFRDIEASMLQLPRWRELREELVRRELPFRILRIDLLKALKLWLRVQAEVFEELEEKFEERARRRLRREQILEREIRERRRHRHYGVTEEREKEGEEEKEEERGAPGTVLGEEFVIDTPTIHAVFTRLEEMGVDLNRPAGGWEAVARLFNDLLGIRDERRVTIEALRQARAEYRRLRRRRRSGGVSEDES